MSRRIAIEGEVYCLTHGSVHEDSVDPYGYGEPACLIEAEGTGIGVTKEMVHRKIFWYTHKEDEPWLE